MKKYKEIINQCPVMAEVGIKYKPTMEQSTMPIISTSHDAYEYFLSIWDADTIEHYESMKILMMNRKNRVIGWGAISSGGTDSCIVDCKIVFQFALAYNAHGFIICHNHPSRSTEPSQADFNVTKKLVASAKLLDMNKNE